MRIGVLGGTFDPPQIAHSAMAEAAMEQLNLDLVLWLVALPWQKTAMASPDVRAHLCELAVTHHPRWQVSYVDLDRAIPSYAIDSLSDLQKQFPDSEWFWLIGADQVNNLESWHRSNELKEIVKFVAFARNGERSVVPSGFTVQWLAAEVPMVSSSEVRNRIASGEPWLEMVEPEVGEYLQNVGLYQ